MPTQFNLEVGFTDLGIHTNTGGVYISGARVSRRKPHALRWPDELTSDGLPDVTTSPATAVDFTTATLNGVVNPQGKATQYRFDYGTTPSLGSSTGVIDTLVAQVAMVPVTFDLTGITPGSTIYFTLVAINDIGPNTGTIRNFTALQLTGGAPVVTTDAATGVTTTGGVLNGTVDANGQATVAYFEYGLTTGYGTETTHRDVGSAEGVDVAASATVMGFAYEDVIHYRVTAVNALGTTHGTDQTLTVATPCGTPLAAPVVSPASAPTNPASDGVIIQADITPGGIDTTWWVEYGTTTGYGTETTHVSAGAGCTALTLTAALPALSDSTTYHYRVNADNAKGTTHSTDRNFTTLTPGGCVAAAPTIANAVAVATGVGQTAKITADVDPNGAATNLSVDYGLTLAYGSNASTSVGAGCDPVAGATVNLAGLTPNTPYFGRAKATSAQGDTAYTTFTFTTFTVCGIPAATPTVSVAAATNITSTSATVNPTVNPKGLNATITIDVGLTTSYGTQFTSSAGNGCAATLMSRNVTGLTANKLYHGRVTVSTSAGSAVSSDFTFTTLTVCEAAPATPTITGTLTAILTTSTVTLAGVSVNPHGVPETPHVLVGTVASGTFVELTSGYTIDPDEGALLCTATPYTVVVSAGILTANTAYQAKLSFSNPSGTATSNTVTFTSPGTPTADTAAATSITSTTATLNATVSNSNVAGNLLWQWDLNSAGAGVFANSQSTSIPANASAQAASLPIVSLTGGQTYKFRVTFTRSDGGGATAPSATRTFATSAASALMWLHVATVPASNPTRSTLYDENGQEWLGYGTGVQNWTSDLTGAGGDLSRDTEIQDDGKPISSFIRAIVYWKQLQTTAPTVDGTGRLQGGWASGVNGTSGPWANLRKNIKFCKDRGVHVMLDLHYNGDTANNNNTPNWLWSSSALANKTDSDFTDALFDNDWLAADGSSMAGPGMNSLGLMPNTAVDGEFGRPVCIAGAGGAQLPRNWGPLTMWLEVVKKLASVTVGSEALAHPDGFGVLDNMFAVDCMNEPPPSNTARVNMYRAFIEAAGAQLKFINPKLVVCYETHILSRNPIFASPSNPPVYGVYGGSITADTDVDQADVDTLPSRTTWPAGSGGWMIQMRGYVNGSPAAGNESSKARSVWDKFALATKYDSTMAWRAGHATMIGEWTMFTANRSSLSKLYQTADPAPRSGTTPYNPSHPEALTLLGGRNNNWSTPGNTTGDYWDGRNNTTKAEGGFLDWIRANHFHQVVWPFANAFHQDDTVAAGDVSGGSCATIAGCGKKLKTKSGGALNITTNNNNVDIEGMLRFLRTGTPYT